LARICFNLRTWDALAESMKSGHLIKRASIHHWQNRHAAAKPLGLEAEWRQQPAALGIVVLSRVRQVDEKNKLEWMNR
jgi:hypothetical protein